jgi:hypothetical protein
LKTAKNIPLREDKERNIEEFMVFSFGDCIVKITVSVSR